MPVIDGDGRRQKQDSPPTNQLHTHSPIRKPQRNKLYQPHRINRRLDTQSKGPLIANGALSSMSTRPKYMCIIYIVYKSAALWARLFIVNSWQLLTAGTLILIVHLQLLCLTYKQNIQLTHVKGLQKHALV